MAGLRAAGPVALPLVLLAFLAPTRVSFAEGSHVRLHGAARIEAQGVRTQDRGGDEMLLRGTVSDDAGQAVGKAAIVVTVARAGDPVASPLALDAPGRTAHACANAGADDRAAPRASGNALKLTTDDAGRFCVHVPLARDRYAVHVAYAGAPLVDAAALDVAVDLGRTTCALSFVPEPRVVSLDAKTMGLDAVASIEGDGATRPGASLALTLANERVATLAAATTDAAGQAHFAIDPSRLGPPGRGEIRLAFAGSADVGGAAHVVTIERHARVELDVPDAPDRRLAEGSPEDGVTFDVTARAAGGDVASGNVEARVNGTIVGAAPIEGGHAKLVVAFALPDGLGSAAEVPVALHYVAGAPWYEPGMDATWRLPVRGRSAWRQIPLALAGLAVLAWFVAARAARVARTRAIVRPKPKRAESRGEAKIDVVRAARDPHAGWRGRVIDADDGEPVKAARVSIERPAFGRAQVLATMVVDDDGRFELPGVDSRTGDELAIDAPLHVSLRRALPVAGELDAQLVLRKRALLGRLVAWAKLRGRPFDARPEPTPGHVRRAASDDAAVAKWADAIERAVFAGEEVDARIEAEVDKLAPAAPVAPAPHSSPNPGPDARALANPTKANR